MLPQAQIIGGLVLAHLGLLSSLLDKIGLIPKINKQLPVAEAKGVKVTMGEGVAGHDTHRLKVHNFKLLI